MSDSVLVNFSIDPEAIVEDAADELMARAHLSELVRMWRSHGVLLNGTSESKTLKAAVESLPQQLRKEWMSALVANRVSRCSLSLGELAAVSTPSDLSQVLSAAPELECLALDDTRAECVGVPEEEFSAVDPSTDVELVRYRFLGQAKSFTTAYDLSHKDIVPDEGADAVWAKRLAPLVRHATDVFVLDRYAYLNLLRSRPGDSGLELFCRRLAMEARGGCRLVVVSEYVEREEEVVAEYRERIRDLLNAITNKRVSEAAFYIGESAYFREHAHDRRIRINADVLSIGKGLEILEKPQRSTFSISRKDRDFEDLERLMKSSKATVGRPESF